MTDQLTHPKYWLLFGLPWPGGDQESAECALAGAPPIIPRGMIGDDACDILTVADAYVNASPSKVVFFSDLTRWLDHNDTTWSDRGAMPRSVR